MQMLMIAARMLRRWEGEMERNVVLIQKLSAQDSWRAHLCDFPNRHKTSLALPPATHLLVYLTDGGSRRRRPVCEACAQVESKESGVLIQEPLPL